MNKRENRIKRKRRVRSKIFGTKERPRISVFRSSKHIYAQLVNDDKGETLAFASSKGFKIEQTKGKLGIAVMVGEKLAGLAKLKKVTMAVFDKGGYKFHGRVKALAEGARRGGLKF
ncbi:50S ribosomal protein L18 [Candidatus Woesebacteria bacterium RIFCSPHIGHO2_02_FULL_42_20]|uniref:Large ribosomal subunit protein uL18 n=1 Tax=Candidatus Woesebacteria bacterium RIFCSPHIGHO2_12_FULL_41_24 TaxID=1802510 RepID=A0A1F8API2_9BACT|nr:MAG: 50S ribosomal protein L18 [Candidatus Woesebacteria bacterium RBG_16_41_13]OGM29250.1 MAG: 50S ribosomal protein L18 [Candidatus Woesebacteria bacterium RIFCSPHIGHO2_01_FULL_42_80]OGM34748.1 MAG: 50S ribosomal protein L18 [Candidatus Woesebacteria bacterium RIFCSPHIGHO2_02_FULL_42_20]OGM53663.1 MAG: 50S ribosomal protein L18 [Candidatus Woesebacteria bacterium RIFCSPHIGHO2_12_FULL_41_24]OGM67047.1 MAG: 50S ribosomal protein L18 [Candidatus Woesebacteria bacterium RIFCSPLOWO2_01_FULL_42_